MKRITITNDQKKVISRYAEIKNIPFNVMVQVFIDEAITMRESKRITNKDIRE